MHPIIKAFFLIIFLSFLIRQYLFCMRAALPKIKDEHLYRQEYPTFEDYCQKRWEMNRAHAYRLIESANVMENLSPMGDIQKPENERQTRPLTQLEPEQQIEAWKRVVETASEVIYYL